MKHKAKLLLITVPGGLLDTIDDFPQDCERSCDGALRVRPGTMSVTEGELAHLRKHHKAIGRRLFVHNMTPRKPKPAPVADEPDDEAPPPDDEPELDSDSDLVKAPKRKRGNKRS